MLFFSFINSLDTIREMHQQFLQSIRYFCAPHFYIDLDTSLRRIFLWRNKRSTDRFGFFDQKPGTILVFLESSSHLVVGVGFRSNWKFIGKFLCREVFLRIIVKSATFWSPYYTKVYTPKYRKGQNEFLETYLSNNYYWDRSLTFSLKKFLHHKGRFFWIDLKDRS